MITIAIANQKGGVGKTTTACHLAHGLALKHFDVLLIDLDSQGQCASSLGVKKEDGVYSLLMSRPQPKLREVVRPTTQSGLWLLPGDKGTRTAEFMLGFEQRGASALKDILSNSINGDRLHFMIFDTAPSAGGLQENALWMCDLLIIPCALKFLSVEGVAEIMRTLTRLNRPVLPATFILPTFFDDRTLASKVNLKILQERFSDNVLPPIHVATVMDECVAVGKTIFEVDPTSRASEEYAQLVLKVLHVTQQ